MRQVIQCDKAYYVKREQYTLYTARFVLVLFTVWATTPPGRAAGGGVLVQDANARKIFKNTTSK